MTYDPDAYYSLFLDVWWLWNLSAVLTSPSLGLNIHWLSWKKCNLGYEKKK